MMGRPKRRGPACIAIFVSDQRADSIAYSPQFLLDYDADPALAGGPLKPNRSSFRPGSQRPTDNDKAESNPDQLFQSNPASIVR